MVVKIRLFGALKRYGNPDGIIEVLGGNTVGELKDAIKIKLKNEFSSDFRCELVDRAAIADGDRVLRDNETVASGVKLALLPPVCGG